MEIVLEHNIVNDDYTKFVYEAYDIQNQEKSIVRIENNIDLPNDFVWSIGVIYGGSGSGKTSLLKSFGAINKDPEFSDTKSLISNFDWLSPEEACALLTSMGLASVPTWLRPYHVLSNGEQYRARLAYMVSHPNQDPNTPILIDEYTSVVDRSVAKAMSNALGKYIRSKSGKKIILASCHFDILEWLQPDWVYSPNKRRTERCEYRRQGKPKITLSIFRCRYEAWNLFKQHHYLTGDLNKASKCFIALWEDKPVAFIAVLPFPNGSFKDAFRGSRTVVLPDYQGLGIGNSLSTYIGSLYKAIGKSYYVRTSNPALINARRNSKDWEECGNSGADRRGQTMFTESYKSYRIAYSFKYIGEPSKDSTSIITFDGNAYKNSNSQKSTSLFDLSGGAFKEKNYFDIQIKDKENLSFDFGL